MLYAGLILLLHAFCLSESRISPIGKIFFQIHFNNHRGRLANGKKCDSFAWNWKCDIYFDLCVETLGDGRQCNLLKVYTPVQRNVLQANAEFNVEYENNDKEIRLVIRVMDRDVFSNPDLIDVYTAQLLPLSVHHYSSVVEALNLKRLSGSMELRAWRQCLPNHYGPKCKRCLNVNGHGRCDDTGRLICLSGFTGPNCSQRDFCAKSNCATYAVCLNSPNGFLCLCDEISGERCERGFDPCLRHTCQNKGKCVATGKNSNFAKCIDCDVGWVGLHCEETLGLCEWEKLRSGDPLCKNNGTCISTTDETMYTCNCLANWRGRQCEVYASKTSTVIVGIIICISVTLFILLILGLIWMYLRRSLIITMPKEKDLRMKSKESNVEMIPSQHNMLYDLEAPELEIYETVDDFLQPDSHSLSSSPTPDSDDDTYTQPEFYEEVQTSALFPPPLPLRSSILGALSITNDHATDPVEQYEMPCGTPKEALSVAIDNIVYDYDTLENTQVGETLVKNPPKTDGDF